MITSVPVRKLYACSFACDLTLAQMLPRLNATGPWRWIERANDNWGDYLVARVLPDPDYGVMKIFADEQRFVADVALESKTADADARFAPVRAILLARVLPALGARDVAPAEHRE